ncbi:MAG: sigma-70 family RNA polymerase sigma factor [Phycisphaerales bacterium]|nr:sigma-70 family RNA polymerase sigma factor [Phycisphaerales bacterium]
MQQRGSQTHGSAEEVFLRVLEELRKIASDFFRAEGPGHTLQPTAVINELWLRLADRTDLSFQSDQAFMAYASRAFRHVLIDHARRKNAERRGGGRRRVLQIGDFQAPYSGPGLAIEVADVLIQFEKEDPRAARVVELRFFGGMSEEEIADVLGVSTRTVRNDWAFARASLAEKLGEDEPDEHKRPDQTTLP